MLGLRQSKTPVTEIVHVHGTLRLEETSSGSTNTMHTVSVSSPDQALKKTGPQGSRSPSVPNLLILAVLVYLGVFAGAKSLQAGPAPASDSLPLELVGTVAGEKSATRFAVIENKRTRSQALYREGDRAGEVLIKRILNKKVVVDAGSGEQMLALGSGGSGKETKPPPAAQPPEKDVTSNGRQRDLQVDRKEIEASLTDIDAAIRQVNLSPYSLGIQNGFMITDIPPNSAFTKIGLQNGDVIKAINGESVTGPDDAAAFLSQVREGGEVQIQISRRLRTIHLNLKIE